MDVYTMWNATIMKCENLLCKKPPIAPPNRLASFDLGRPPRDSFNVFREGENGPFHIAWMLSM